MNLDALEKSEVSKTLYGQIQWEEISRSGVFLQHRDVSIDRNLFFITSKPQIRPLKCNARKRLILESFSPQYPVKHDNLPRHQDLLTA